VLVYRRNWKATLTAVSVFVALNALLSLPVGLPTMVASYRQAMQVGTGTGSENDPFNPQAADAQNFLHATRFFMILLGPNRPVVQTANLAFTLLALGAMAWVMRPRPNESYIFEHPLDIAMTMMAALALVYHRYNDLAALMFVAYGLIDYRIRYPERQP